MSSPDIDDFQPDATEVLQTEEPAGTEPYVKVEVCGVVRTQALPRKGGRSLRKTVDTTPDWVLRADPRRARTILIGSADFLIAFSSASAQEPAAMALWPLGLPLELTSVSDVWIAAETGTAEVSIITEQWAMPEGDGD